MTLDNLSITEADLVIFFEGEHISRQFGSEWFDSDSLYEYKASSDLKVTFSIHPIHHDIRICLFKNEINIYDYQGIGVQDILYLNKEGNELLRIEINDTDRLELQLSPTPKVVLATGSLENMG